MTLVVVAVPDPGAAQGFHALVAGCGQCSFFDSIFLFLLSGFFCSLACQLLVVCLHASRGKSGRGRNQSPNHFSASSSPAFRWIFLLLFLGCTFFVFVFFACLFLLVFVFVFDFLSLVHCLPSQLLFVATLVLHCLPTEPLCPTKWQPNDSSGLHSESKRER